jgi:hypothetical protein
MKTAKLLIGAGLLAVTLDGCGYDPGTRALTGGAIGAGGGALLGAAVGGNPAVGALAGAGVGAVAGAVTAPR